MEAISNLHIYKESEIHSHKLQYASGSDTTRLSEAAPLQKTGPGKITPLKYNYLGFQHFNLLNDF